MPSASPRRSVVIPMFREATRIEDTVQALAGSVLDDPATELIFVDDGSDDDTAATTEAALAAAGLDGTVLRLEQNQGKGGAVKAGVLASSGDAVCFVDADLSAGIDEIDRCLNIIEEGVADVALGTRTHPGSIIAVPQPPLRQLSGKVFNKVLRVLGLTSLGDTQCGLKAFKSDAAKTLFGELQTTGFAFDVELLVRASRHGLSLVEVPIVWRHVEASRVRPFQDSLAMLLEVLRITLRVRRGGQIKRIEMSTETFDSMAKLESEHWWFRAKRELALQELASRAVGQRVAVDVGCGTGELACQLRGLGERDVIGIDLSTYALGHALERAEVEHASNVNFLAGRAEQLPLQTGSASCLISMDVIEHLDDPVAGLREYLRVVEPGGVVLIAVPAYQWAWSEHDELLGHRRRYTAPLLKEQLEEAGLVVERTTHYHSWLVPVAFLLRKTPLRRLVAKGSTAEEASFVNPAVNQILLMLTRFERRVQQRASVPFGLSVLAVARAPKGGES